jgi:23S rRNA (adenine2503-C2)-methyltransferase
MAMVRLAEEHIGVQNRRFTAILDDGYRVECVLYRDDTLCVSSQVGCAVGCPFCASGASGLTRPLSLSEMQGQVVAVRAAGHRVERVTVSGVGEPLHAADAVESFIAWCRNENIKPSLTTSGGPVARLRRFLELVPHNGLTISIHAGTEPTRARLVPNGPPLSALFETLRASLPRMGTNRKKKTALAYLLLADDNDGDEEVDAFASRAAELALPVHLFAFNPVPTSDREPTSRSRYEEVYARIVARGLRVRMSSKARVEANGGCGTLVALGRARA